MTGKPSNHASGAATDRRLNRLDLWRVYMYSQALACGFNYDKQEAPGFTTAMIPVIEKVYIDPVEKREAYRRHTELFNTEARLSHIPIGVCASLEERHALDSDVDPFVIGAIKSALAGPLAAIGDSVYHGTWRPIVAGIAVSLVVAGDYTSLTGPILFVALMAISGQLLRWMGIFSGYKYGINIVSMMQASTLIGQLTELAAVAAYVVIGGFVPVFVAIGTPIHLSVGSEVVSLQTTLDALVPGLVQLLFTGLMYWLMVKKKISQVVLLAAVICFGIVGVWLGFLS